MELKNTKGEDPSLEIRICKEKFFKSYTKCRHSRVMRLKISSETHRPEKTDIKNDQEITP